MKIFCAFATILILGTLVAEAQPPNLNLPALHPIVQPFPVYELDVGPSLPGILDYDKCLADFREAKRSCNQTEADWVNYCIGLRDDNQRHECHLDATRWYTGCLNEATDSFEMCVAQI